MMNPYKTKKSKGYKGMSRKLSKSVEILHLDDIEELSSALEKFHYDSKNQKKSKLSESSIEICVINDSDSAKNIDSDESCMENELALGEDSGMATSDGVYQLQELERKVDQLSGCFLEQSKLLAALREEVRRSHQLVEWAAGEHSRAVSDVINITLNKRLESLQTDYAEMTESSGEKLDNGVDTRARSLMEALEFKQRAAAIDGMIKTALTDFLQSDALKDHVVEVAMKSMKKVIVNCFTQDVTSSYMPLLERSHRRLLQQVTRTLDVAFRELEANSDFFTRSSCKTSKSIQVMIELLQKQVHDSKENSNKLTILIKKSIQQVLENEVSQWREKFTRLLEEQVPKELKSSVTSLSFIPNSPPQPVEPGKSAIEQLMTAAEINVQMKDGDVNGSFEKALSASDLSLVMAACRAADPATIFSPKCRLKQHTLLSLVQQLSTDMVHDTQLKCRYLEEALMNLNIQNDVTRTHLPKIVTEVCNHLSSFLNTYPSHMSSRKVKILIMAAKSLLLTENYNLQQILKT